MKQKKKEKFDKMKSLKLVSKFLMMSDKMLNNYGVLYPNILKVDGLKFIKETATYVVGGNNRDSINKDIKIEDMRDTCHYEKRMDKDKMW